MIGRIQVFHPAAQFLFLPEDHPKGSSEVSCWRVKQQECISLLRKCKTMEVFEQIHGQFLKLGLFRSSFSVGNLLATCALSDWGSMGYAASIFGQIDGPDSFQHNTMIRGYVKGFDFREGLAVYLNMMERGVAPDSYTYPFALKACAGLSWQELGIQIHQQVIKLGFLDDVVVQNSLINMYGKCGRIKDSRVVFEQLEEQRTVASWGSLISAHANVGMWWECIDLFKEMNRTTTNGYRLGPELNILVSVLSACTHLGAFDLGRSIHGYLMRNTTSLNVIVETALMDMYMKCGSVDGGLLIFQRMAEETKNQQSYSVVISGLAAHGRGREALQIFSEMLKKGINPDDVVYLGVLSACRHSGLVEEGKLCLDRMEVEHGIEPSIQHYGCMVDLLGRAGRFNEALQLINKMPMNANDAVWRAILNASRVHQNLKVGELAATKLMNLGSENAGDYVLLSNIYAQAQRWEDVAVARTQIASRGLDQKPGFCSVEVRRKMHYFLSQDKSHPSCVDIYEMIHQMEWQLKFEGYQPDSSEVLCDVEEEEKRQRLRHHSQKLALAFALINTSKDTPIRLFRNVRMCNDCHTYTKLVSIVYGRVIVVRDRNRFHHIKDGSCSCRDYSISFQHFCLAKRSAPACIFLRKGLYYYVLTQSTQDILPKGEQVKWSVFAWAFLWENILPITIIRNPSGTSRSFNASKQLTSYAVI